MMMIMVVTRIFFLNLYPIRVLLVFFGGYMPICVLFVHVAGTTTTDSALLVFLE